MTYFAHHASSWEALEQDKQWQGRPVYLVRDCVSLTDPTQDVVLANVCVLTQDKSCYNRYHGQPIESVIPMCIYYVIRITHENQMELDELTPRQIEQLIQEEKERFEETKHKNYDTLDVKVPTLDLSELASTDDKDVAARLSNWSDATQSAHLTARMTDGTELIKQFDALQPMDRSTPQSASVMLMMQRLLVSIAEIKSLPDWIQTNFPESLHPLVYGLLYSAYHHSPHCTDLS